MGTDVAARSRSAEVRLVDRAAIRFAGDSRDGIQLAGDRFAARIAAFGNDVATLPSFPAEIRAPAGTLAGVSSFQVQFADHDVLTPGDNPDVLVAMNPTALKANIDDLSGDGILIVNTEAFTRSALAKAGHSASPLDDGMPRDIRVSEIPMGRLIRSALEGASPAKKDAERAKSVFALGLLFWMYHRPVDGVDSFLRQKFAARPRRAELNIRVLRADWNHGETTEAFAVRYRVHPASLRPGTYRQIAGNRALAYGLIAAGQQAGLPIVLGSYPITPASDILHELAKHKNFAVTTVQAEDEIAGIGAALGASYGGLLGVTATSGPGIAPKSETIGLAVMTESPLVVIDVQRSGPSTGMPTKTEQADLLQAMFGRNGESPVPVLAPATPAEWFGIVLHAARIALTYRTPVVVLSDSCLANGAEPWRIPELSDLPDLTVRFATEPNAPGGEFRPYLRDAATLARPWAVPGTPGLEHRIGGLEKADNTDDISYDTGNHDRMVRLRQAKIDGITVPDAAADDPTGAAEVLAVGRGSTFGAIAAACRRMQCNGIPIAHAHLRHLNPFPENLDRVLSAYRRIVVPELNLGQLATLLRGRYLVNAVSHTKVTCEPFTAEELENAFTEIAQELR
ncbi:2-oxoacid:acceptor oxidoreductase subunit alpha [Amycolatopsis sp. NPDC059090]|uniref:2-oxoacid:acceptor oxidoreductase subunit alpha n=1 Tax=Amycolatopsis sp. NPDC059090 TaxID=3346723 RepID=UPI00366C15F8